MDKISIIIPVYNVEPYIIKCLDSIINQTYTNLELLCINDGSTDYGGKICDEYAMKDNRIKVFHQHNQGVSAARNVGLNNFTGDYIGFVDSDDWIEPEMFEKLHETAVKHNKQISFCSVSSYFNDQLYKVWSYPELEGETSTINTLESLLSPDGIKGSVCNKLFHIDLITKATKSFDTDIHYCEDLLFCIELLIKSNGISYAPEVFYHYYALETGAVWSFNQKRMTELRAWQDIIALMELQTGKLLGLAKNRYFEAAVNLVRLAARAGEKTSKAILREESKRYRSDYLKSPYIPFKHKLKTMIMMLFPVLSDKIWLSLKKKYRLEW